MELSELAWKGYANDPLKHSALKARGIQLVSNQEYIGLYLLKYGPVKRKEVREALTAWREQPKTWYCDYFYKWNKLFIIDHTNKCVFRGYPGLKYAMDTATRVGLTVSPQPVLNHLWSFINSAVRDDLTLAGLKSKCSGLDPSEQVTVLSEWLRKAEPQDTVEQHD